MERGRPTWSARQKRSCGRHRAHSAALEVRCHFHVIPSRGHDRSDYSFSARAVALGESLGLASLAAGLGELSNITPCRLALGLDVEQNPGVAAAAGAIRFLDTCRDAR